MVTALATVAIAVFTLTLWRVTSRTVELARDEFYASHRPFIRVRNINVRKVNGVTVESTSGGIRYVKSGEIFSGQFYVANIGRADCRLTGAYLTFWAGAYGLPMARPYEGRNENLTVPAGNMTAGWRWPVPFNIAFDTSGIGIGETVYPDRTDVFAMGWVEYIDDAHRGYRTTFCRWYDPDRRRFMPYADAGHDYEAEE